MRSCFSADYKRKNATYLKSGATELSTTITM